MKYTTTKLDFHLKTPCFPEKYANQKSIHFPFLIVLLVLRDEPLLAPSVCNFLFCPHVSRHKHVILTEDFVLQGMFTTNLVQMSAFPFTDMPYNWPQQKSREVVPIISIQGDTIHF